MGATGIVLAGGRSTRFGSRQARRPYRGVPLLHHAVLRLAEVCGEVIVVLAPDRRSRRCRRVRRRARPRRPRRGGSARRAVARAGRDVDRRSRSWPAATCPSCSTAVLLEMLRVAGEAPVDAVALQDGDRFRPLPCRRRVAPARDAAHAAPARRGALAPGAARRAPRRRDRRGRRGPRRIRPAGRCSTSTSRTTWGTGPAVRSSHVHEPFRRRATSRSRRYARDGRRSRSLMRPRRDVEWEVRTRGHPWAFAEDDPGRGTCTRSCCAPRPATSLRRHRGRSVRAESSHGRREDGPGASGGREDLARVPPSSC